MCCRPAPATSSSGQLGLHTGESASACHLAVPAGGPGGGDPHRALQPGAGAGGGEGRCSCWRPFCNRLAGSHPHGSGACRPPCFSRLTLPTRHMSCCDRPPGGCNPSRRSTRRRPRSMASAALCTGKLGAPLWDPAPALADVRLTVLQRKLDVTPALLSACQQCFSAGSPQRVLRPLARLQGAPALPPGAPVAPGERAVGRAAGGEPARGGGPGGAGGRGRGDKRTG